jgi:energy-converting hydrogenase A subunit M
MDILGDKAKIRVCNKFKAWEEKMLEHIEPRYGSITIEDMFNWSRLHKEDLDGLRPMCEDIYKYEAVAIYRIPEENYKFFSMGWFSPNHACSSIYVPFHICNTDIYDPYESGESAQLSLDLLNEYGHGNLIEMYNQTEHVFLNELNDIEKIIILNSYKYDLISDFLTIFDMSIQKQAFLTEDMWLQTGRIINQKNKQEIIEIISKIWDTSYSHSFDKMKHALFELKKFTTSNKIIENLQKISLDICRTRIDILELIGIENQNLEKKYNKAAILIENEKYEQGFEILKDVFIKSDMAIKGQYIKSEQIEKNKSKSDDQFFIWLFIVILILTFSLIALPIKAILK